MSYSKYPEVINFNKKYGVRFCVYVAYMCIWLDLVFTDESIPKTLRVSSARPMELHVVVILPSPFTMSLRT